MIDHFFLAFLYDKTAITVIDISEQGLHEKYDYDLVNDIKFESLVDAIGYARKLCKQEGLQYQRFESRYDLSSDGKEYLYLKD